MSDIFAPKHKINTKVNDLKELEAFVSDATTNQDSVNWSQSLFNIPSAWSRTMGEGAKVAILDTGIDVDHQDLATAVKGSKDFTSSAGVNDKNGHGTHCAGVIGARLNGVGFVGIAPKCDLYIAKVLGDNGSGDYDSISNAVAWAVDQGVDIISMSLGGPSSSPGLFAAIHYALAKGVSVICAAGNEGSVYQNSIGYPGRYGGVITIAAHDQDGNRSGFSSKGGEIDFMAPGSDIWSTYIDGGYASLSGTSMATPFVAGLAALVVASQKGTPNEIRNCEDLRTHLMTMASHPGYHDNTTGYGPLNPLIYFSK